MIVDQTWTRLWLGVRVRVHRSGNREQASAIGSDRDGPGHERLSSQDPVQAWLLMDTRIRDYGPLDEHPVVELSLRAWAPVFNSLAQGLGREGGVPLLVEKWANAGSGTDAMRRQ